MQQFTKAINVRGGEVYTGIVKNANLSSAAAMTYVMEHTKSAAESKQVYDKYVPAKLNEGFSIRSDWVEEWKAEPGSTFAGLWIGRNGAQKFFVFYRYYSNILKHSFVGSNDRSRVLLARISSLICTNKLR